MRKRHAYTMMEVNGGEQIELAMLLEDWIATGSPPQIIHPHHTETWCSPGLGYGRVLPHTVSTK